MLIHETVNLYVYAQLSISPTNGTLTHQKSKSQKLHYLAFLSQLQIKASGQACQQLKQSLEESQGRLIVAEQTAQEAREKIRSLEQRLQEANIQLEDLRQRVLKGSQAGKDAKPCELSKLPNL